MAGKAMVLVRRIESAILLIRGQKVMLDSDLANLYAVPTRVLNQAVRRNRSRFPRDFMFQLNEEETLALRSQFVILDAGAAVPLGRGKFRKYRPLAFTEQGVAMLSSVLRSDRAVEVNIEIMRAFVRIRHMIGAHAEFARKLEELERKYDGHFKVVFDALRQLMATAAKVTRDRARRGKIGFGRENER
jgi:hypothetical protein